MQLLLTENLTPENSYLIRGLQLFKLPLFFCLVLVLGACGGDKKSKNSTSIPDSDIPVVNSSVVFVSSILSVSSSSLFSSGLSSSTSGLSSSTSGLSSSTSSLDSSSASSLSRSSLASSQASTVSFVGSAYLKTRRTMIDSIKGVGPARLSNQLHVDQCNQTRASRYDLPPVSPNVEDMAKLDVQIHEKFYDNNKALTLVTGNGMILTDMRRWLDELSNSTNGSDPAVPPDCSMAVFPETKSGVLWVDRIKYEIRFNDKKAIGNKYVGDQLFLLSEADYFALPVKTYLGQSCHEIANISVEFPDGLSCMWDHIPYIGYLNWPFLLQGKVPLLPGVSSIAELVEPLIAEQGKVFPAETFAIPEGFTVVVHD